LQRHFIDLDTAYPAVRLEEFVWPAILADVAAQLEADEMSKALERMRANMAPMHRYQPIAIDVGITNSPDQNSPARSRILVTVSPWNLIVRVPDGHRSDHQPLPDLYADIV